MRRLLILSCSKRKRPDPGLVPAIARYDGPAYRVLRRFLAQRPTDSLAVYVLSAQFGLIPGATPIPDYDQRMTAQRAVELRPAVTAALIAALDAHHPDEVLIWAGRDYMGLLAGYETVIPEGADVRIADGPIGRKLTILHDWLYGERSGQRSAPMRRLGRPRLRGVAIDATPADALDLARQALATGRPEVTRFQSWYVPIDGHRIAPKWLVSQLTGLPTSAFVTDEARRVLARLGIEVRRV